MQTFDYYLAKLDSIRFSREQFSISVLGTLSNSDSLSFLNRSVSLNLGYDLSYVHAM